MKKTALTFAISLLISSIAFAGSEAKEIVPQPVAPAPCFDGWYIGIHGAGVYEEADIHTFTEAQIAEREDGTDVFFDERRDHGNETSGGFGGLQLGRNFQFGSFVVGLEGDFSIGSLQKEGGRARIDILETDDEDASLRAVTTTTTQLNWYATVRPRVGYVFWNNRLMVFGTGGFAAGQADFDVVTDTHFDVEGDTGHVRLHRHDDDPRTGWTAGGGFDFCVSPRVILNLTYLYMDLGNKNARTREFSFGDEGEDSIDFAVGQANSNLHYHVFQAGVNFKF